MNDHGKAARTRPGLAAVLAVAASLAWTAARAQEKVRVVSFNVGHAAQGLEVHAGTPQDPHVCARVGSIDQGVRAPSCWGVATQVPGADPIATPAAMVCDGTRAVLSPAASTVDTRRLLGEHALAAAKEGFSDVVFALSEVGVYDPQLGWNTPEYLRGRLDAYCSGWDTDSDAITFCPTRWKTGFDAEFLATEYLCDSAPAVCKINPLAKNAQGQALCGSAPNRCLAVSSSGPPDRQFAESGEALLSSTPLYKVDNHLYQWYPATAFDDGGQPLNPEWGKHRHGLLAGKVNVNGKLLWVVTTHLDATVNAPAPATPEWTRENPFTAERQIWELLGFVARLDPDVPVLLVGDLNIAREGQLQNLVNGSWQGVVDLAHQGVWQRTSSILAQAGFRELGTFTGPCWSTSDGKNLCSFKASTNLSGAKTSRIDQAFLLDPKSRIDAARSSVKLSRPMVDDHCFSSDHMVVTVDLQFK